MLDQLFDAQDDIGKREYSSYAIAAGVPDPSRFETCRVARETEPIGQEGQRFEKTLELTGTPTVLIDGYRLGGNPTLQRFDSLVARALTNANQ
jgi:hypothetical protein